MKVSTAWEEDSYVHRQRCSCGGTFGVLQWEVRRQDTGRLEVARVECKLCQSKDEFWFDISDAMANGTHNKPEIGDAAAAWPPPSDGPYVVRQAEYAQKRDALRRELEAGTVSQDDFEERRKQIIDQTHPRIGGTYQVYGSRRGSMGVAYLCQDACWRPGSGRPYAVVCKTLNFSPDQVNIDALRREAKIWVELGSHPNIVQLYDVVCPSPGRTILVLEAIPPGLGGRATLREWIDRGAVTLPLAITFSRDLCRGMRYARSHVSEFVHGDLKPENLLVSVGWVLKISDFGLARAAGFTGPRLGESLGTPLYLAPECWQGRPATQKSDVYAVGIMMYEMLAGKHPFSAAKGDNDQLARMHLEYQVPGLPNSVPASLSKTVMMCVEKDPERRPDFGTISSELGEEAIPPDSDGAASKAAELNNKGKAYADLGSHLKAIGFYLEALTLEPANATGWANLAVSCANTREYEQAEKAYRLCFELPGTPPTAYANYAALLLRKGDPARFEDAIRYCDQTLATDPGNLCALVNKAALLNSMGRHAEAAEAADRARTIDPGDPHVWVELGTACWRLGRYSKATDCAKRALRLDPQFEAAKTLMKVLRRS